MVCLIGGVLLVWRGVGLDKAEAMSLRLQRRALVRGGEAGPAGGAGGADAGVEEADCVLFGGVWVWTRLKPCPYEGFPYGLGTGRRVWRWAR